jgi:hypothetical protein
LLCWAGLGARKWILLRKRWLTELYLGHSSTQERPDCALIRKHSPHCGRVVAQQLPPVPALRQNTLHEKIQHEVDRGRLRLTLDA